MKPAGITCEHTGKHWHSSRAAAFAQLRSLRARDGQRGGPTPEMDAYPCEYCGGWHVGRRKAGAHRSRYGG